MWDELPQRFSGHAVLLFVNKKKQKNFRMALRAGIGDSALSARPALQGE
jgi:hypothetical protein